MSDLETACDKAVKKFLTAVQGKEPTKEQMEKFREDTGYCESWIEGFKEGIS